MKKFKSVRKILRKNKINILVSLITVIVSIGLIYSYFFITTPANIRKPEYEHLHFRMQLIVDGIPVDFSDDKFQENKPNVCSAKITNTPIHFHDNLDQFIHIHWRNITGGQVLKYYGWNYIGGNNDSLGRRFDQGLFKISDVKIRGKVLPVVQEDTNFYIYVGDENGYTEKQWSDFIEQDLETFFGKKSNVNRSESFINKYIFKKAYAHDGSDHGKVKSVSSSAALKSVEELTRINNLMGNVVIFTGEIKPTDDEVKTKFANLVPLQDSSCGG